MKKHVILWLVFLGLMVGGVSRALANDGNPYDLLQSLADRMIASLKTNKTSLKTNPSVVYSLTYRIIVPHADIAYMAKRVLPRNTWNNATPSQRDQFKDEFTKLLVSTYASALADYNNQTVKFYPVRGGYQGKTNVSVRSQIIRSDGPGVGVNYRLIFDGSVWKLYDISVEGVSLLESFRSQFADKLSTAANMDDLIRELKQHNSRRGS